MLNPYLDEESVSVSEWKWQKLHTLPNWSEIFFKSTKQRTQSQYAQSYCQHIVYSSIYLNIYGNYETKTKTHVDTKYE